MNRPLAIFAPQIGALSETFIQHHMRDLLPGGTVIVAGYKRKPYSGHWDVQCPQFIISDHQPRRVTLKQQLGRAVLWKLGMRKNTESVPGGQAIRDFLREHEVRCILAEYLDLALSWLDLAREMGLRLFAHAHGYDISERLRHPYWRQQYTRLNEADGIIAVSQLARQRLIELQIEPDRIHVIPCGVDMPPLVSQHRDDGKVRCFCVGRMVNKKSPIYLLEAFRRAHQECPELRLDYVGTGELLVAARQFVEVSGLSEHVTLHGGQSHDFVLGMMEQADLFLLHSVIDPETGDEEGLPVSILEAMARSLPIVSTRHSGIPEAVEHLSTGLLVEEADVAGMAEHIIRLAKDAHLRRRLGEAGRLRAEKNFAWEVERSHLLRVMDLA